MKRRQFLQYLGAVTLTPWQKVLAQLQGAVIELPQTSSTVKYLLLDSRVVDRLENACLRLGKVKKDPHNPLFVQDKPWEMRWDNADPAVLFDEQENIYKAWYNPMLFDQATAETPPSARKSVKYYAGKRKWCTCYVRSKDGIIWDRPDLGLVEFNGSTKNNMVQDGGVGSVVKDLRDRDPARRYKSLLARAVRFSPDGFHWAKPIPCPEINALGDTHNNFLWDEKTGKYVGFTRLWEERKTKEGQNIRIVARTESPDFLHWTPAVGVLRGRPDPQMQPYALLAFRYANIYLGLIALFDTRRDTVHCELAWSPDTIRWERLCPGTPLIARGPKGSFDWGCIFAAAFPIVRGGEIRLYYVGSDGLHTSWRSGGFGLARLRPDGFAGIEPTNIARVGTIVTEPVQCAGKQLRLSADAEGGTLRVAVVDANGLGMDDCEQITTNVTDGLVSWRGGHDLTMLKGKSIRLRFELKAAKLYAFSFTS